MNEPFMLYFGPWDGLGHFMHMEEGRRPPREQKKEGPWDPFKPGGPDGGLQPEGPQEEGKALLHHKDGWTALAFWDRTVDHRGNSCSTYIAEGVFTFTEMVEMAKTRFAPRWNKMKFEVVEHK